MRIYCIHYHMVLCKSQYTLVMYNAYTQNNARYHNIYRSVAAKEKWAPLKAGGKNCDQHGFIYR